MNDKLELILEVQDAQMELEEEIERAMNRYKDKIIKIKEREQGEIGLTLESMAKDWEERHPKQEAV